MAPQELDLSQAFSAIADPIRRDIVRTIWLRAKPAGEIASRFDISRPAVSRHLRVLREAGLVTVTTKGTSRLYRTDQEAFFELRMQLDEFWQAGRG